MPVEDQRLVFDNIPMMNDRTISDYKVPRGGVLILNPPGVDTVEQYYIFVHLLTGKTVLVSNVDPADTVEKVKKLTKDLEDIPQAEDMILQWKGRVMEDDVTLLDYDVLSGSTLVEGLERAKPVANMEVSSPNDRYEAAFSQAQKAATAEKNGDIDYAAALYQNAGETLLRAAENELDPSLRAPVKAKGDDLLERANLLKTTGDSTPVQPRRMTIVQSADPETGLEGEPVSRVTPRSKSIGGDPEMDPMDDDELDDDMIGNKKVIDDLSPEAGLRYTPVNTTPKRFDDDGYGLRAAGTPEQVWGKLSSRQIKAFALVTCYNESGEFLRRTLSSYAKNIYMMQQVFGEKVWEEMPVSVIIDGKSTASQSMLDYCQNDLQLFSPEVMAISSLGLEVQMHLFERTIFMPKVDNIPMPPMHVILGLKENNCGKLDSHAWFFEAFCEPLQPKYVILIDVGTVATETAVFRCLRSMDRDAQIAAVHAEPTVMKPNFCHITVAAQHFEYKVTNIMDRSLGSVFGFIDLLPGCFTAYRFIAVKTKEHPETGIAEGPLVNYFQTLTTPMTKLGPFLGNMHLASGRVLCFEIVARWNEKWTMHYCKGAVARTDAPDSIEALIRQRKRWLNGTFFASVYTLFQYPRIIKETTHSVLRKFFFFFEWFFIAIGVFMTWFTISNLFLIFYYVWQQGLNAAGDSQERADDILLFLMLVYLSVLIVQFLVALGNRPEDISLLYRLSAFYFGAMIIFCLVLQVIPLFNGDLFPILDSANCDNRGDLPPTKNRDGDLPPTYNCGTNVSPEDELNPRSPLCGFTEEDCGDKPMLAEYTPDADVSTACILYNDDKCEACEDSRGSIMWTLVVVVGLYFVGALIQGELHHVAASVIQYFAMMPTFVNIVAVYAFANLHDLSWGTKGKLAAGAGQGGFKERKKGRGSIANFIEREKIARDEEKARAKQAKAVSSQFETFRSLILCTWMLTNFWWANLWFYEDPAGFCYLNYVGWFIIVVALLKLVGSIIFVGIRSCRGFGERLGICSRPYKYEVGVETPVVPKKSIFSGNVSSPPVPVSASRGDDEQPHTQNESQGSAVVEQ
jgi:cellulose synthase/poly-beta-1,6-N-acetylglucosamine synthase-like glycosyltransferase